MFAFIVWSQVEFSTTTFAAVLTIFGYSINATVVIFDRMRQNIRLVKTKNFNDIIDSSISETFSRSIITTVTTLFASLSLMIFTSGSIRDFSVVLTVGLISGCYSSMFISSGFVSFARRNWEPGEFANHVRPHSDKNVISFSKA
jgi:preprotein translocase subunit SecF